jgi:hypothetical protein
MIIVKNLPTKQLVQEFDPAIEVYFPASQSAQTLVPDDDENSGKLPQIQDIHTSGPTCRT